MFGLFKKDFSELREDDYQKLATITLSGSAGTTSLLLAGASSVDGSKVGALFLETLAFATCLLQMRVQSQFKFTSPNQIIEVIKHLQWGYENASNMGELKLGATFAISRETISEAATEEFFEHTCFYAARDYQSLGFSEAAFDQFCRMTHLNPSLFRGAGVNLALVIHQMCVYRLLFSGLMEAPPNQGNAVLKTTRDAKDFFIEKIDRLLKQQA